MDGLILLIALLMAGNGIYGCVYKYAEPIKSGKEFILDYSTYKCTKTNELKTEGEK